MSSSDGTPGSTRAASLASDACEHYHAGLHRFLMRRLRSAQNAQDLAQETYLRLLRVDRTEFIRKPQAYLYRIAANLIYEFRLREQRDPVTFDSEILEQTGERTIDRSAEDASEELGHAQQLEELLAPLPPLYRAAFILRKRDGMSYPEIARTLDISVHTVKKYLARAVAHCRTAVGNR
jgi:RNA polymerase sigma-70 factor (ECF subfamily)